MNTYQTFFKQMNPEEWECFATDFLYCLGFSILSYPSRGADGGKDAIVEKDGIKYIVSAKHFIHSGSSVKPSDEQSIIDRIIQHQTDGFIGFYSTIDSEGLRNRLNGIKASYPYILYTEKKISEDLPYIPSDILQKYGLPNNIKYVMNINPSEYQPLKCMICNDIDILEDNMIRNSIAQISININNELEFLYGCKECLLEYRDMGWLEVYQAIHQDQFIPWNQMIDEYLLKYKPSSTFFQNKNKFDTRIQQRMFPSNWGKHSLSLIH